MDPSGFEAIAPYLKDPLVLSGLALLSFFGALRFAVKRLPVGAGKIGGIAVKRLAPFGFVVALIVIVLGLGLRLMEPPSDPVPITAEHRARLAEKADRSLKRHFRIAFSPRALARALAKAQTDAVSALAQSEEPETRAALEALAKHDTAKAKAIFERIIMTQAANAGEAAATQRHLGALAFLDNVQEALAAYRRSTELDPDNATGWNLLGILFGHAGRLDDAAAAFRKVRELGMAANKRNWQAKGTADLGTVYMLRDDLDGSEAMYWKALAIYEELDHRPGIAAAYSNLGDVFLIRRDLDGAEAAYGKALAIYAKLGHRHGMAATYGNLGDVYWFRVDLDRAKAMYGKALAIDKELGHKRGMAVDYRNLAAVYENLEDPNPASAMFRKAVVLLTDIPPLNPLRTQVIGELLNSPGDG